MKKALLVLGVLVLAGAAVLYLLGRGRVGEVGPTGWPPGLDQEARLMSVRLYFGDPRGIGLKAEDRTIAAGPTLSDRLEACIRELARGSLTGSAPSLPPDTKLSRAFTDPWGLGYLDFTRAFLGDRRPGDGEEWLAVASLVRTVCDNFPEVRRVRILVEGRTVTTLGGSIDLEEPLSSEEFPLEGETR